ncbi:HK97 family phage prohead protease [Asticcacaulis sp. EMRT-3]|uniref:HK97 family phage prohead protease n=1 Tax=Asticcacaulis sp. EMRT-3 TaxID=3040349 RepID=UPI0024AEA23D|nr:HK97 family phage prohead protease [Asticcacaulis sp. EMRT-3]MDI7775387.1 HK97 family phage prohead protease [Asticcacaulis sp. EMRT-3]
MSLTIVGYASRFGLRDLNDDVVVPGAFRDSLLRSGPRGVRMLYQHAVRSPVGVWDEIREDAIGLFVRGRIIDASPEARMVASLVRSGVVDGLSIGFRTQKSRPSDGGRLRVLSEVELWEISIVTFPMLPSARITRFSESVAQAA